MKYFLLISLIMMNVSLFFVSGLIVFKVSKTETYNINRISTPFHLSYLLDNVSGIDVKKDYTYKQTPMYGD